MAVTDTYISLDEATQETGLNGKVLLRMSLNKQFWFYHHFTGEWYKVPFFVVEALYDGKDSVETPCLVEYEGAWRKTVFEGICPGKKNTITRSWKFSLSSLHIHRDDIKEIKQLEEQPEILPHSHLSALDDILNEQHPWHSEFLATAVKAWIELYSNREGSKDDNQFKPNGGHTKLINDWLSLNGTKQMKADTTRKHFCAIINPSKQGGCTKNFEIKQSTS